MVLENRLSKRLYRSDPLLYRADELNTALCLFLKERRDLYDGDSIYYLCLGIQHYLRENRSLSSQTTRRLNEGHFYRTESLFFDPTFLQFQSKLHSILARFCHHRDPSRPLSMRGATSSNIDDRPSRIEEELLWEAKQLGAHTPWVLLNTILYFNTKYFFLKTVNEHQVLSFSNVRRHHKRNVGPHGEEYGKSVYLRYYPPTTTIHGMEEQQLIYEQAENYDDPLRCPVKLFEFYLTKCPESVKCRPDVLYLLPEATCVPESPLWFSSQPLPASTMDHMLTRIKTVRDVNDIHLSMSQTSFDNNNQGRS
ncbi:unnamed protein product [Adineta steineri]|uniref:DUF3504 domain-containing protein n=1 Tax=Adineta steineri TaxID=433720 RepID=A0A814PB47_9BILA|nr:unnamed protein product [Adineta steineri]